MSEGSSSKIVKIYAPCNLDRGRLPFDQKFRNEIPGIPFDEWNSIFRVFFPVGWTKLSHIIAFQVSRENTN